MCIIARAPAVCILLYIFVTHPQVGNDMYVLDRPPSVGQRRAITNTRNILVFATADTHRRHPFHLISAKQQNNFRAHNTNHQSTCASHHRLHAICCGRATCSREPWRFSKSTPTGNLENGRRNSSMPTLARICRTWQICPMISARAQISRM
jgi:hypothetical protein